MQFSCSIHFESAVGAFDVVAVVCKRKEEPPQAPEQPSPKKPRLVFTDLQRRTLQAIFKVETLKISSFSKLSQLNFNQSIIVGDEEAVQGDAGDDSQTIGPWTDNGG